MRLGLRGRVFLWTLALVLLVDLAVGLYLSAKLRQAEEQSIETQLVEHARAVRSLLDLSGQSHVISEIDPIADAGGGAVGSRITLIAADGTVLGDSDLEPDAIALLDRHHTRPEVVSARNTGQGVSRRYSATLQADMLYVAIPWGEGGDVVRAARPMTQVEEALKQLQILLLVAGVLAVGLATLVGLAVSEVLGRTLRRVAISARKVAGGHVATAGAGDELGVLVGSMSNLATELEDSVSSLASERDRLSTVLESMHESLIALDAQRRVTLINRAALDVLQIDRDLQGANLLEVIRAPAVSELVDAAARGDAASVEVELGAPPRQFLVHASATSTGGTVLVMHDVTDVRRLEKIRQDFVANVSHELRTPVSIIQANAETLLSGALDQPEHAKRFLDALHRSAERLGRLVSDLLDISRIEAGSYAVSIGEHALRPAAVRVVEGLSTKINARNVTVTVEIPQDARARFDPKALEQILVNLIDNAIKYTPDGGVVEVSCQEVESGMEILVKDQGPGIDPALRDRVFERFFRVDEGRSRDLGGTGLGLAIVKHLSEALSGSVRVQGRAPNGSVFIVRVPHAG